MLIHPITPSSTPDRIEGLTVAPVHLAYVFDLSCPWCYMGLRNLRNALKDIPNVNVRWLPFIINPDIPATGLPFIPYMERRFGGAARLEKTLAIVRSFAHRDGLNLAFDRIGTTPNTLAAHALVQLAQGRKKAWEVLEDLFAAYFCQGRDIGDTQELVSIGVAAGLNENDVVRRINSTTARDRVRTLNQQIHHAGLNRVPCLIVNERYTMPGAQDTGIIRQFIALMRDMG